MSFLLANGLIEVVVPVGQKICVTSYGAGTTKVEAEIGPNNYPIAFSLLKLITNSDYISPVFTKETIVKITAGLCDVEYIVGINPFPTISRVTTDNNGSFLLEDNTVIDGNLSVSGLLGLGVTPSAWNTAFKAFQGSAGSLVSQGTTNYRLWQNAYIDSGAVQRYVNNGFGSSFELAAGEARFFTAPSGTAGDPISFTQAMTLTQSGNLLVGTAVDSGANLTVNGSGGLVVSNRADASSPRILLSPVPGGPQLITPYGDGDPNEQQLAFASGVNGTERARITSDGNLLVGTTNAAGFRFRASSSFETVALFDSASPAAYINISDSTSTSSPQVGSAGNNLVFRTGQTSNTERARITAGGNQINFQPAESAQNTSATLTVSQLQSQIITANAAVTLTLPTGTALETYTTGMAVNTAFEVVFIATTANAITIDANGNTTVGSLTINGNTSGTFRFRKTSANTFTVYRTA